MNELWRDYSANQDITDTPQLIDPQVAVNNGVVGFIMRSGSSWTYKDPTFNYLYPKIGRLYPKIGTLGAYRSSYHNFSPGANIGGQLKIWFEQHPVIDIIPRFAAVEINWNNLEPYEIGYAFFEFSNAYKAEVGERPGIYTRKELADRWLTPFLDADFLNEHWWWIAQYDDYRYTEQLRSTIIPPNKVSQLRCWLKQTADQMAGFPGEAESTHVDRDRFQFEDMDTWITTNFGDAVVPPVEPPVEPPIEHGHPQYVGFDELVHTHSELELRMDDLEGALSFNQRKALANTTEIEKVNLRCDGGDADYLEVDTKIDEHEDNIEAITNSIIKCQEALREFDAQAMFWDLNIDTHNALADKVTELEAKQTTLKLIVEALDTSIDEDVWKGILKLQNRIEILETKTIPECNHSHRSFFSWLWNRR